MKINPRINIRPFCGSLGFQMGVEFSCTDGWTLKYPLFPLSAFLRFAFSALWNSILSYLQTCCRIFYLQYDQLYHWKRLRGYLLLIPFILRSLKYFKSFFSPLSWGYNFDLCKYLLYIILFLIRRDFVHYFITLGSRGYNMNKFRLLTIPTALTLTSWQKCAHRWSIISNLCQNKVHNPRGTQWTLFSNF